MKGKTGTITCPECSAETMEEMPSNACLRFFECRECATLLRPRDGDCCVFCSYGDQLCPPKLADELRKAPGG